MNKSLQEIDKLFKNRKYNQVIKKAKKLVTSKEVIPPFYNLLGLSLAKIGKDQESEICFIEGIKKFPNEISLKSNIALIQLNLKKLKEAEKSINDALKINDKDLSLSQIKRLLYSECSPMRIYLQCPKITRLNISHQKKEVFYRIEKKLADNSFLITL